MWKTYAKHGLAEITVRRDGHVIVNSSPIKGFATKIFRHRLATNLMDNMHQHKELGRNRVKHLMVILSSQLLLRYMEIKLEEVHQKKEQLLQKLKQKQ